MLLTVNKHDVRRFIAWIESADRNPCTGEMHGRRSDSKEPCLEYSDTPVQWSLLPPVRLCPDVCPCLDFIVTAYQEHHCLSGPFLTHLPEMEVSNFVSWTSLRLSCLETRLRTQPTLHLYCWCLCVGHPCGCPVWHPDSHPPFVDSRRDRLGWFISSYLHHALNSDLWHFWLISQQLLFYLKM